MAVPSMVTALNERRGHLLGIWRAIPGNANLSEQRCVLLTWSWETRLCGLNEILQEK